MTSLATLSWKRKYNNFYFTLSLNNKFINIPNATNCDIKHSQGVGTIRPLLSWLEEGIAYEKMGIVVIICDQDIASHCTSIQAQQLGLPSLSIPYKLKIQGRGAISSPNFKLLVDWVNFRGQVILGINRDGTLLSVDNQSYLLTNPLYSVCEKISLFLKSEHLDLDEKMLAWGEIQKILPDDSIVNGQLETITIVSAECFTLDLDNNDEIHPILINDEVNNLAMQPLLSKNMEKRFSDIFRSKTICQKNYALGNGHYVVISDTLITALNVVKKMQQSELKERMGFFSNPTEKIRQALEISGQLENNDDILTSLFIETPDFINKRIERLGEWKPKLFAYIKTSNINWLGLEEASEYEINITINGNILGLNVSEVNDIHKEIQKAMTSGLDSIEFKGNTIPANSETVETVKRIVTHLNKNMPNIVEKDQDTENEDRVIQKYKKMVPIITDNIETLGYEDIELNTRRSHTQQKIPSCLRTTNLYPHQEEGVAWLQDHWKNGSKGALLADDMGLGKTLQCLTFMAWVKEAMNKNIYSKKPLLIVAPTGLLKNWQDEENMHLKDNGLGRLLEAYGNKMKHISSMSKLERGRELSSADWVLTTYETLRDKIQYFLPIEWGVVVFDEVQKIKNPSSRTTEMAKSLSMDFSIAVTGTPVENALSDLWCIIDTIMPGYLGSLKDFNNEYVEVEDLMDSADQLKNKLLRNTNPSILLRRMKDDHLKNLPKKTHLSYQEIMPEVQANIYSALISEIKNKSNECTALESIQKLRSISLMPEKLTSTGITDEEINNSARLKRAILILDSIAKKRECALIFVESLELQEALTVYLKNRYSLKDIPNKINGKIPSSKRKEIVNKFQSTPLDTFKVLLLSPKAGGVGITLTRANHVIHLSRWWNPAVEDQCSDRVYRIGQMKTVYIHYPLAIHPLYQDHSFDMNLEALLSKKRNLSHDFLPNTETEQDIKTLLDDTVKN